MNWKQICIDPLLKNLPYKIELNQWGQIVMSPANVWHVMTQDHISDLLKSFLDTGRVLQEFPMSTTENVKAPDVVWISDELLDQVKNKTSSHIAPALCIEIMSPGNTKKQLLHKKDLYLAAGAQEVWICKRNSKIEFYDKSGILRKSKIIPKFPAQIESY
ncbi:hypothetical protein TI05_11130 [Achromatium sp. WMS3]|nr:hypothetical protein TI05_11130 [Achromatium sp. WMS3]